MIIKKWIDWATYELIAFDSACLDAELILSYILKKDRSYLLAHDDDILSFFNSLKFRYLVRKRKTGFPLAYILGKKEFYGIDFKVNKNVLIPRPETEDMVEAVISYIQEGDLLVDVGTGSACIPISVLKNLDFLTAFALDISSSALKIARQNAKIHAMNSRIQFFQSNLFNDFDLNIFRGIDFVLTANLPYVPLDYQINIEAHFEPPVAIYAKDDGLDLYKKLLKQILPFRPKALFFECFDFQKAILLQHAPDYSLKHSSAKNGGAGLIFLERS